jgi:hypothetical protein
MPTDIDEPSETKKVPTDWFKIGAGGIGLALLIQLGLAGPARDAEIRASEQRYAALQSQIATMNAELQAKINAVQVELQNTRLVTTHALENTVSTTKFRRYFTAFFKANPQLQRPDEEP